MIDKIARYLCQKDNLVPEIDLYDFLAVEEQQKYLKIANDLINMTNVDTPVASITMMKDYMETYDLHNNNNVKNAVKYIIDAYCIYELIIES